MPHGKQALLASFLPLSAALFLARSRWGRTHLTRIDLSVITKDHLGVWLAAPAKRLVGQDVSMHDGDFPTCRVEAMHYLASGARRLIHARIRWPFRGHNLGHASGKGVREIESVEDRPKLTRADSLYRGSRHMSESLATALSRFLQGGDVPDLVSALESQEWDSPSSLGGEVLRLVYEFDHGDWSLAELREEIRRLVEPRPQGIIIGIGVKDIRFGEAALGAPIRRLSAVPGQTSALGPLSRSEPRSGIGIGEKPPVEVQ